MEKLWKQLERKENFFVVFRGSFINFVEKVFYKFLWLLLIKDFPRFPLKTKLLKISINLSHFGHHCNPKQISQRNRENQQKMLMMSQKSKIKW